jgi:ubiquinone/menaquinone biosynthesis C-methylase UbiE
MGRDAYVDYTRRFFGKWLPYYDLFALSAAWVYRAAVTAASPRPGQHLLDLCTGTGQIALRCARRGARVTAVDLTPAMLERARRKGRRLAIDWRIMDGRALAFDDDSFDVVTLSLALHDMPGRVQVEVLREAGRVARRRLVIADYAPPVGPGWLRRAVVAAIELFETPYFSSFVRAGGVEAALAGAGLPPASRRRADPLFFAVWSVEL